MNGPYIVVGCHRSGTSSLAFKMQELGVFMGHDLNNHSESIHFMQLNEYLFEDSASTWDAPENLIHYLSSDLESAEIKMRMKRRKSRLAYAFNFLGLYRFLFMKQKSIIWGWKDPRNSITLPVWLKIYPQAKIIYIRRDGEQVANSLYNREIQRHSSSGFASEKCKNKSYGLQLWQSYERAIHSALEGIDEKRILKIDFNQFISGEDIDRQLHDFIYQSV